MAGKLRYSGEALGHLDRLTAFLVSQADEKTAHRVIDELLDAFEILSDMPYIGRVHPDPVLAGRGYRILVAGRYVGVYLVIDGEAWMAAVYHTKTDWLTME